MNYQVLVLGSGTSTGVPIPGCDCSVCHSPDPKDRRLRTSLIIQTPRGKNILIDTGPDLRTQVLAQGIQRIDAVVITHDHADHLHGINDLRPFCFQRTSPIPVYATPATLKSIATRFDYLYHPQPSSPGGAIPLLDFQAVAEDEITSILGEPFYFFTVPHGPKRSLGLTIRSFGYVIDCQELEAARLHFLRDQKLELLIIDCLKKGEHPTHLSFEQVQAYLPTIAAQRVGLIHMGHFMRHQDLLNDCERLMGPHVKPLFDGQVLSFS